METQRIQRQAGTDAVSPVPYNIIRAEDAHRSVVSCPPPTLKSTLQNPPAPRPPQVQAGVREEASGVDLIGGLFVDGFPAQIVAAFVLLHAVHHQQDQENGEEDAHLAATSELPGPLSSQRCAAALGSAGRGHPVGYIPFPSSCAESSLGVTSFSSSSLGSGPGSQACPLSQDGFI
uniref:Uncharacterized protein n=1 Tax=Pipistrellus kuhlii TaxID=59472 RepID=A0A7J8A866_PIPKU|nr:hypothetical protein mPipKuh1_008900 [Pipistrellus kuhlii]